MLLVKGFAHHTTVAPIWATYVWCRMFLPFLQGWFLCGAFFGICCRSFGGCVHDHELLNVDVCRGLFRHGHCPRLEDVVVHTTEELTTVLHHVHTKDCPYELFQARALHGLCQWCCLRAGSKDQVGTPASSSLVLTDMIGWAQCVARTSTFTIVSLGGSRV